MQVGRFFITQILKPSENSLRNAGHTHSNESNLYRYVLNSPLNGTDPTGQITILGYQITTTQILNGGIIIAAGTVGCLLGSRADIGPQNGNPIANSIVRGGVFLVISSIMKSIAATAPGAAGLAGTKPLATAAFFVGVVVCLD